MNEELILKLSVWILPVGCFIAGFFMLRFSLKLKKKLRQRKEDCSIAVKGAIVNVIKKYVRNSDPRRCHIYYPVYEYMANGEQTTVKSEYGSYTAYQVGTQVDLYYNPRNPTEIYVPDGNAELLQISFFWGGLLFLFMVVVTLTIAIMLSIKGTIYNM